MMLLTGIILSLVSLKRCAQLILVAVSNKLLEVYTYTFCQIMHCEAQNSKTLQLHLLACAY